MMLTQFKQLVSGFLFEEGPILNLGMALERELAVAARRPTLAA